jgi:ureidoglycolate hydrolase
MFERHAFTTQAFIPMAKGEWGAGVGESAMARTEGEGGMLVIVALNGPGQSLLFRLGLLFGDRDGD